MPDFCVHPGKCDSPGGTCTICVVQLVAKKVQQAHEDMRKACIEAICDLTTLDLKKRTPLIVLNEAIKAIKKAEVSQDVSKSKQKGA